MKFMKFRAIKFLSLLSFLSLALTSAQPISAADLYIYSASSVASVLEEAVKDYQKDKIERDRVHIVAAATSALAWQIERGAKADIFITAHSSWLKRVKPLQTAAIAHNQLVLVAQQHQKLTFTFLQSGAALKAALADRRIALGDTSTPLGLYTKQALNHHQLWTSVQNHAVFGPNARAVLSWVARGDVAAAIIYASDLHAHSQLQSVARPAPDSHEPISYQMALLSPSSQAQKLWTFLQSDQVRAKLQQRGFLITP